MRKLMVLKGMSAKPPVEDSATGNPLKFLTDLTKPLLGLTIPLLPRQSGTGDPSPENVRPITGWQGLTAWHTGGNLLDDSKRYLNAAATSYFFGATSSDYEIPLKAGTYTISAEFDDNYGLYYKEENSAAVALWSAGKDTREKTFTIEGGVYRFYAYNMATSGGIDPEKVHKIMLNYGETALPYSPYTGQSYPVVFPAMGKNLYPIAIGEETLTNNGGATHSNDNGALIINTANGAASGVYATAKSAFKDVLESLIGKTATMSFDVVSTTNADMRVVFCGQQKVVSLTSTKTRVSITATVGDTRNINLYGVNSVTTFTVTDLMVETGDVPHTYEPFTNTVYGGTIDLVTGVLTVTHKGVVLDGSEDETWEYYSVTQGNLFRSRENGSKRVDQNVSSYYCNSYKPVSSRANLTLSGTTAGYLDFINNDFSTLEGWKENLQSNPIQVVYPLVTPLTYQLTPQQINALVGENTIWSDTNGQNTAVFLKKR